jgi:hypothetical protein
MSSQSGREDNRCDAPPYSVVKASQRLGFRSPLDVRWCRMHRALAALPERPGGLRAWMSYFWGDQPRGRTCSCGHPLPALERYTFTFVSGKAADYLLGQCRRCRAIFWEEAAAEV